MNRIKSSGHALLTFSSNFKYGHYIATFWNLEIMANYVAARFTSVSGLTTTVRRRGLGSSKFTALRYPNSEGVVYLNYWCRVCPAHHQRHMGPTPLPPGWKGPLSPKNHCEDNLCVPGGFGLSAYCSYWG